MPFSSVLWQPQDGPNYHAMPSMLCPASLTHLLAAPGWLDLPCSNYLYQAPLLHLLEAPGWLRISAQPSCTKSLSSSSGITQAEPILSDPRDQSPTSAKDSLQGKPRSLPTPSFNYDYLKNNHPKPLEEYFCPRARSACIQWRWKR